MALLILLSLVAAALLIVLVIGIVRLIRQRGLRASAAGADLQAVERWTALWRWVGLLLGGCLAVAALARADAGLGRLALATPAIAGCSALLAIVVGEWTIRPSTAERRSASLATRTIAGLLPRARSWVAGAGVVTLATLLGIGVASASPDDQGRAGRAITTTCFQELPDRGSTLITDSHGPWPGSFYALPAALFMLITIGLGIVAARAIRDRANPDAGHTAYDTHLRRDAMRRVVSAVGATAWGTAGPIAIVMGTALNGNQCIADGDAYAGAVLVAGLTSLIVAVILAASVLLPGNAPRATVNPSMSVRTGS